jgi:hypothetical protein
MSDDTGDGGEEAFAFREELFRVFHALIVQPRDHFGFTDFAGGVLSHFLQDAFGKIVFGFMGHGGGDDALESLF